MRVLLIVLLVLWMVPVSLCAMVLRDSSLWLLSLGCFIAILLLMAGDRIIAILVSMAGRRSGRDSSEAAAAMRKDDDG